MPRGAAPREYPPEIIALVVNAYTEGHTVREIQELLPPGYKAQRLVQRYVPERRAAVKRNQTSERNSTWKGADAGYKAMHLRVVTVRGKPSHCSACDRTDKSVRYEWANLSGHFGDVHDYVRLCVPCHRRFDGRVRANTGG